MSQYLQNTDAHFFDYPAAANFFLRDEPDEDEDGERRRRRDDDEEEEEPEDDEEDEDEDDETRIAMTAIRSEPALRA